MHSSSSSSSSSFEIEGGGGSGVVFQIYCEDLLVLSAGAGGGGGLLGEIYNLNRDTGTRSYGGGGGGGMQMILPDIFEEYFSSALHDVSVQDIVSNQRNYFSIGEILNIKYL